MKLGNRIRELRESQGLLQRELSSDLEIDTPIKDIKTNKKD